MNEVLLFLILVTLIVLVFLISTLRDYLREIEVNTKNNWIATRRLAERNDHVRH